MIADDELGPSQLRVKFSTPSSIATYSLVTLGRGDGEVTTASSCSDVLVGIASPIKSAKSGEATIIIGGIATTVSGGNISRGDALTANADGHAITSTSGTDRIVGLALQPAMSGDHIQVLITQG